MPNLEQIPRPSAAVLGAAPNSNDTPVAAGISSVNSISPEQVGSSGSLGAVGVGLQAFQAGVEASLQTASLSADLAELRRQGIFEADCDEAVNENGVSLTASAFATEPLAVLERQDEDANSPGIGGQLLGSGQEKPEQLSQLGQQQQQQQQRQQEQQSPQQMQSQPQTPSPPLPPPSTTQQQQPQQQPPRAVPTSVFGIGERIGSGKVSPALDQLASGFEGAELLEPALPPRTKARPSWVRSETLPASSFIDLQKQELLLLQQQQYQQQQEQQQPASQQLQQLQQQLQPRVSRAASFAFGNDRGTRLQGWSSNSDR